MEEQRGPTDETDNRGKPASRESTITQTVALPEPCRHEEVGEGGYRLDRVDDPTSQVRLAGVDRRAGES